MHPLIRPHPHIYPPIYPSVISSFYAPILPSIFQHFLPTIIPPICPLILVFNYLRTHTPFIHLPIHSSSHLPIHPCTHSPIHQFTHPPIRPLAHTSIHLPIHTVRLILFYLSFTVFPKIYIHNVPKSWITCCIHIPVVQQNKAGSATR
jgi:hypothetical protein